MTNTTTPSSILLMPSLEAAWQDVDVSFDRFCLVAGIGAMEQVLREDAQRLTGPHHGRGGGRVGHRWGITKGKIGFHGGKVAVHRPRVRGYDGHEVELPSWTAAQAEDWLGPRRRPTFLLFCAGINPRSSLGCGGAKRCALRSTEPSNPARSPACRIGAGNSSKPTPKCSSGTSARPPQRSAGMLPICSDTTAWHHGSASIDSAWFGYWMAARSSRSAIARRASWRRAAVRLRSIDAAMNRRKWMTRHDPCHRSFRSAALVTTTGRGAGRYFEIK